MKPTKLIALAVALLIPLATGAAPANASTRQVTIAHYTDAPLSQLAINRCQLVLWSRRPLYLAGHNYCNGRYGWAWIAHLRQGTVVQVLHGRARGRWVVVGRLVLHRQGGAMPALVARQQLVLQTCLGKDMVLQFLRRARVS